MKEKKRVHIMFLASCLTHSTTHVAQLPLVFVSWRECRYDHDRDMLDIYYYNRLAWPFYKVFNLTNTSNTNLKPISLGTKYNHLSSLLVACTFPWHLPSRVVAPPPPRSSHRTFGAVRCTRSSISKFHNHAGFLRQLIN